MKKRPFNVLISLAIICLFLPNLSIAKGKKSPQWFLTPRIGTAFLLNEVNSSFTAAESEFEHSKGLSADIALSRTIGSHFEIGLNVGYYQLGSSNDSLMVQDLKAFNSEASKSFYPYPTLPIEYNTTCVAPNLFVRFFFKKFPDRAMDTQIFQPYLELSAGQNFYQTELIYSDISALSDPKPEQLPSVWIPRDPTETYEPPYQPKEQALQYAVGIGSRFNFNGSFILNLSAEVSNVNTAFLDGTPNVATDEVKSALVPKIMLGVAIPLGKSKGTSKGKSKGNTYLPWAH
jgi:hypothetical protein